MTRPLQPIDARDAAAVHRALRDAEVTVDLFAALAVRAAALPPQERRLLEARMQDRYATLRWFIIGVISLSLVITAYVLTGAMRATRV